MREFQGSGPFDTTKFVQVDNFEQEREKKTRKITSSSS